MADDISTYAGLLWTWRDWGDAVVSVGYQDTGGSPFKVTHIPVAECPEALSRWAAARAKEGRSLYVGIAPRRASLTPGKRGGRADLVGSPALWVDIDCAEGEHAPPPKGELPTMGEARQILASCPAPPSFTVASGGGIHAYWLLDEPVDALCPIFRSWKAYWDSVTETTGKWVDRSAFDPARSLRLPGSVNPKGGRNVPVVLELPEDGAPKRWSLDEISSLLDEALGAASTPDAPGSQQGAGSSAALKRVSSDDERVGSVLARELPVSSVLSDALGWTMTGETGTGSERWHVPGGESSEDESQAESRVDEDGVERAWGYSPRAQAALGASDQTPVSSWDFLSYACGGSYTQAARIAKAWQSWPEDERNERLISILADHSGDVEAMLSAALSAAAKAPAASPQNPDGEGQGEADPHPVRSALAALNGTRIPIAADGSTYVVAGGVGHGVWMMTQHRDKDGEMKPVAERVIDWVPVRSKRTLSLMPMSPETASATWTVEVVAADGSRESFEMDSPSSLSVAKIQEQASMGLAIPEERGKRATVVRNCLALLGAGEREDNIVYTSAGWTETEDGHMLVLPAGSVRANGTDTSVMVRSTGVLSRLGFAEVASKDELAEAIGAVAALVNIVPGRPEVGVALMGALAAAPLRMPRRCSVMLVAGPDVGKSLLARCATAWMSPSRTPPDATYSLKSPTEAGAAATVRWSQDIPLVADDFRRKRDRRDNSRVTSALQTVIGAGYQDISPARATVTGDIRATVEPQTVPIVTGEDTADEEMATMSRTLVLHLSPGDVDRRFTGPVQQYLDKFVGTSLANKAYASYISWIAGQLDSRGPWAPEAPGSGSALESLRATSESKRTTWYMSDSHEQKRSSEIIAPLAVGFQAIYDWATDMGLVGLLPPKSEIDATLEKMADMSAKESTQSGTVEKILDWARMALETGDAFLNPSDGKAPSDADAYKLGWRRRATPSGEMYWDHHPRALELGTLSKDGQMAVISGGAWKGAAERCDDTKGLSPRQIRRDVLQYFGLRDWQRKRAIFATLQGAVVPVSLLFNPDDDKPLAPIVQLREPSPDEVNAGAEQSSGDRPAASTDGPGADDASGRSGANAGPGDDVADEAPPPSPPSAGGPVPDLSQEAADRSTVDAEQGQLFGPEAGDSPPAAKKTKRAPKPKKESPPQREPVPPRRDPKTGLLIPPTYSLSGPSPYPGEPPLDEVIIL